MFSIVSHRCASIKWRREGRQLKLPYVLVEVRDRMIVKDKRKKIVMSQDLNQFCPKAECPDIVKIFTLACD